MKIRKLFLVIFGMMFGASVGAETATTTTTTTNPDGTTTTTVEETTTESTSAQDAPPPQSEPNLVGPDGATGVIRRSDRRQDRRAGDPRINR